MMYKIDGVEISGTWSHQLLPAKAQAMQAEQIPGIPRWFTITGPIMPPHFIVTGFLYGTGASPDAAVSALDAEILSRRNYGALGQVCDVTIGTTTYPNCKLVNFYPQSMPEPVKTSGAYKMRIRVVFQWQQLAEGPN